jgi:DNA-binding XRE family transcriptional regulator
LQLSRAAVIGATCSRRRASDPEPSMPGRGARPRDFQCSWARSSGSRGHAPCGERVYGGRGTQYLAVCGVGRSPALQTWPPSFVHGRTTSADLRSRWQRHRRGARTTRQLSSKRTPVLTVIESFAENLVCQRSAAGLTQAELAKLSSLHRTEISLLERGAREPRLVTVLKLAGGLSIDCRTLLAGIAWVPARAEAAASSRASTDSPSP